MRENLRQKLVTLIENQMSTEINFTAGGVSARTYEDMKTALADMKKPDEVTMETITKLVKVIDKFRAQAKLKETGVYNALNSLDVQKNVPVVLKPEDVEKEDETDKEKKET